MAAQQVGSLYLDLSLDPTAYYARLEEAERRSREVAARIEKRMRVGLGAQPLKPRVDDRELIDLNKHFDLKVRHYNQVRSHFANNPLVIKVDDRDFKRIGQKKTIEISTKVSSSSTNDLEKSFDKVGQKISRSIERSVNPRFNLLSPLTSALGIVARGAFEGIGQQVSAKLGKGISTGVEKAIAPIVGSSEVLGEKIGDNLTQGFSSGAKKVEQVASQLFNKLSQMQDLSGKQRRSLTSAAAFFEEGGLTQKPQQRLRGAIGEGRVSIEKVYQQGLSNRKQQGRIPVLSEQALVEFANEEENINKAKQQLKELNKQSEDLLVLREELNYNLQKIFTAKTKGTPQHQAATVEVFTQSKQLEQAEKQNKKQIESTETSLSLAQSSQEQMRILAQPFVQKQRQKRQSEIKPKQKPKTYYENLVADISQSSGLPFEPAKLPTLKPAQMQGSDLASYDRKTNSISVSPQTLENLQKQRLSKEDLNLLVHEVRHAVQHNFGADLSGEAVKLISPSGEEARKLGKKIEQSVVSHSPQQQPQIRKLEADAYAFAERYTPKAYDRMQKEGAITQFQNRLGVGAGKVDSMLAQAQISALKQAQSVASTATVDISKEYNALLFDIQSYAAEAEAIFDKAKDLDVLPVDAIKNLEEEILSTVKEQVGAISQSVAEFKKKVNSKASGQSELEGRLQQANKQEVLVPIARSLGIKSPQKQKKTDLIAAIKSTGDLSLINSLLPPQVRASSAVIGQIAERRSQQPEILKESLKSAYQQLSGRAKENLTGSQLIDFSSDIEKEYQTILGLLSSGLSDDANKILQMAKLNIGRLRKQSIDKIVQQHVSSRGQKSNPVTQAVGDGQLYAMPDIQKELESLRIAAAEQIKRIGHQVNSAKQSLQNKQSISQSNKAVANAGQSINAVETSINEQRNSKINGAIAGIEQDIERTEKELAEFFRNRIKEYEKIIAKASQQIDAGAEQEIVNGSKAAIGGSAKTNKVNNLLINSLERKGLIVNESPLQVPVKSPKSSGFNSLIKSVNDEAARAVKDVFDGIKESVRKQSVVASNELPALSADLLSSSAAYQLGGDEKSSEALLKYKKEADEIQKKLIPLLNKPLVSLNPEETETLNKLNKQAATLFDLFDRDIPEQGGLVGFISSLNIRLDKLDGLLPSVTKIAGVVAAIAALVKLAPQLMNFAKASLAVAANMEALQQQTNFAVGGKKEGAIAFNELRSQSERFGLNRQATIEQGSSFLATTRGTSAEGEQSLKILESLNQAARVYNLTIDAQGRAQVALQQIVSKGVVSQEELRGQLSEAIPGAAQTAARAYGVTVQELNKMIAAGLDGSEFVQKFASQLGSETAGGLASALNTTQAASSRFENSMLNLQEATGKALLPLQNFTLNALTIALDTINKSLPILLTLLAVLATRLATITAQSLAQFISQLAISRAALFSVGSAAKIAGSAITTSFKQFALVAVIGVGIRQLVDQFKDLSGELRGQVKAVQDLRSQYDDLVGAVSKVKPPQKTDLEVFPDRAKSAVVGLFTGERKQMEDSIKAIADSRKLTPEIIATTKSADTQGAIAQIKEIDKQLELVQIKRRSLVQLDPGNSDGLRSLQLQEKDLINQRSQASNIPDNVKQQLQAQADAIKAQIDYLEKLKKDYPLYGDEVENVNRGISKLKQDYEDIVSSQTELNKTIGKGSDAFSNLRKNIKAIADDLADASDRISLATNNSRIAIARRGGQLTPGQEQGAKSAIEISILEANLRQQIDAAKQSRALLDTPDNQARMQDFGVNETTGRARLETLAEAATNPEDKFLFEQLAALQQQKLDISNQQVQLEQAKADTQKQLIDLTKQVGDYYRGISRNAQQQAIEMQKLSNQVQTTQQQNKLRAALLDGYDTIVSQFVDSIIESIAQINQVGDRSLDAQSQLLQAKTGLEDTLRSGVELSRNLPTVPVKLDFGSIPTDNNIAELSRQVNEAVSGSDELGKSINYSTDNASELYKQLLENVLPIDEANQQFNKAIDNTENLNQSLSSVPNKVEEVTDNTALLNQMLAETPDYVEKTADNTKTLNDAIAQTPSFVEAIQSQLLSVLDTIGNLITRTGDWLGAIANAPNKIDAIVGGVQQLFGGGNQQSLSAQSSTGVLAPVAGGITSGFGARHAPVKGASTFHDGIDYGVGVGTEVKAPTSGVVSRVFTSKNGGGNVVEMKSIDAQGREIVQSFLHLQKALVQEGQAIAQGQAIAKSGNTGIGSGAHLHWRVHINGKAIDPKQFLGMNINVPGMKAGDAIAAAGKQVSAVGDIASQTAGAFGAAFGNFTQKIGSILPKGIPNNQQPSSGFNYQQAAAIASNGIGRSPIVSQTGTINRGGNSLTQSEIAKLTPLGRELYQYQQNPNVLAIADTVARAEGTDFRNNSKNFGYGMLIGGKQTNNFATHPFVGTGLKPRHNSTAAGRYQMMNFNYDRSAASKQFGSGARADLNDVFQGDRAPSFSPAVQDLYFIYSLKKRGVLDEVLKGDIPGALNKTGINSLSAHYASLENINGQGYYKGQKTPEGMRSQTIPFAQQRLRSRLKGGQQSVIAANNFTAASPQQLRSGIGAGMQLATQSAQQQAELIGQQQQVDTERQQQEATRKANQAIRQYEKARRDQANQLTQRQREITDFGLDANRNPSPQQRQLAESTQLKRRIDDAKRDRMLEIEDRQRQTQQAKDAIASGALNGNQLTPAITQQLQQGIAENEKAIPELQRQLQEITRIGADYEKDLTRLANREERLKRQNAAFELAQGEIAKLQQKAEALQILQQSAPQDDRLQQLPQLQEEIELKQSALELDRAIAAESEKLFKYEINQSEYENRIELLKKENIARQENAFARREQAEAEMKLQKAQREMEVRSQMQGFNNEYLQNQLQLRQLGKGGRNPLEIQKELNLSQMEDDFARREMEIQLAKNRTPEEKQSALAALGQVKRSRLDVINAESLRSQEDNAIAARDLFNQSNIDVVQGQIGRFKTFGQDKKARKYEQGLAEFQQQTNFQNQIKELERLAATNEEVAKSADLIRANYEALNEIKLEEISSQFNEFISAIAQVKDATQGLFSDLISGADNAFANFGKKILDYFTQLAAQMLTNDLFNMIGGMFGGGNKSQQGGGGGAGLFGFISSIFGGGTGGGGTGGGIGDLLGGLFFKGGYVPNYASGYNPLHEAMQRERSQTGRRAYIAVLSEGERVLNHRETKKFSDIGGDRILRMASGGIVGQQMPMRSPDSNNNVSVSNNINIQGGGNVDVPLFRQVLDGRIREIIKTEQRSGGSLNRKSSR
jgi:tape measure domain-containing protein